MNISGPKALFFYPQESGKAKSKATCYICQHKKEVTFATHVCKQCRLFLCYACCSTHIILPPSKDHVIMELGRIVESHDLAYVLKKNETEIVKTEVEEDIMDSDYECQGGLSTFFNAPENARLTKVSEFEVPSVQNMFCLADGRICVHTGDEIIIYSNDYTRQFAIESSSLFGVIHTGGNTIAILDFFLNIQRLKIEELGAKLMDKVRLLIPPEICTSKPNVKKLSRIYERVRYRFDKFGGYGRSKPAFFFRDCQYSVIHVYEMASEKVPVWCTFSMDGKPLRTVVLSADFDAKLAVQNHQKLYVMADEFIRIFNQCGGYKKKGLPRRTTTSNKEITLTYIYTDGDYVIYQGEYYERTERKYDLIMFERGTKKERTYSGVQFNSITLQNNLDRIIIGCGNKYTVLGLS
ncbi:hypothetical protein FSP39_019650 [Pinctada imbricata]|uniref:Uncharacterized protein n=1 Tax=Pinctada imbricata TaxID=66713 RepID=A0AA88YP10_PINIB|nr:hypothetical protein FSP39_019650 [Pinctada imbricata]